MEYINREMEPIQNKMKTLALKSKISKMENFAPWT